MVKTYHLSNASESAHAFAKYIFTVKFVRLIYCSAYIYL